MNGMTHVELTVEERRVRIGGAGVGVAVLMYFRVSQSNVWAETSVI